MLTTGKQRKPKLSFCLGFYQFPELNNRLILGSLTSVVFRLFLALCVLSPGRRQPSRDKSKWEKKPLASVGRMSPLCSFFPKSCPVLSGHLCSFPRVFLFFLPSRCVLITLDRSFCLGAGFGETSGDFYAGVGGMKSVSRESSNQESVVLSDRKSFLKKPLSPSPS